MTSSIVLTCRKKQQQKNFFTEKSNKHVHRGLPRWCTGKESTCQGRRHKTWRFDPRVRKICPREGNGNPLQYSCLENSTDRGAWQAVVHGVSKSRTRLSTHKRVFSFNWWFQLCIRLLHIFGSFGYVVYCKDLEFFFPRWFVQLVLKQSNPGLINDTTFIYLTLRCIPTFTLKYFKTIF